MNTRFALMVIINPLVQKCCKNTSSSDNKKSYLFLKDYNTKGDLI